MEHNEVKPAIAIDLKKYRIRIHKTTLRAIGSPQHILLLVNPDEQTLAVLCGSRNDPRAHRISWSYLVGRDSFEIYSKSFIQGLRAVFDEWRDNCSYRMYGEINQTEGVATFRMPQADAIS